MAVQQDITAEDHWFAGEDKILEFEPLLDDGKELTDPTKGVEDVTGWSLVFSLKKKDKSPDPALIEKRTGGAGPLAVINIVGVYNISRAANTQRIQVIILDDDTDALKAFTYRYSVKRLASGADEVLVFGNAVILKATAPPA